MLVTPLDTLRTLYAYFSLPASQTYRGFFNGSGKIWQTLVDLTSIFRPVSSPSPFLALPVEMRLEVLCHLETAKDKLAYLHSCSQTYSLYVEEQKEALVKLAKRQYYTSEKFTFIKQEFAQAGKENLTPSDILFLAGYFAEQANTVGNKNACDTERQLAAKEIQHIISFLFPENALVVQGCVEQLFFNSLSAMQILLFLEKLTHYDQPLSTTVWLLALVRGVPQEEKIKFLLKILQINHNMQSDFCIYQQNLYSRERIIENFNHVSSAEYLESYSMKEVVDELSNFLDPDA